MTRDPQRIVRPDDFERPASAEELAALDALRDRGVDLDGLEPKKIGRLVRTEKARQAAQRRREHEEGLADDHVERMRDASGF